MSPMEGSGLMKAMIWKRRTRCRAAVSIYALTTFSTRLFLSPVTSVSLARDRLLWPTLVRADKRIFFPLKGFLGDCSFFLFSID